MTMSINDRIGNNRRPHDPVLRFIRGDYDSVTLDTALVEISEGWEQVALDSGDNNCIEGVFGDGDFDSPISEEDWHALCDATIFSK